MPLPAALLPAVITGGSAILGSGINSLSQGNLNKRNRRWSEQMYNKQYNDNLAFWAMQNEYNSPQAQMQRFQAAGLNPNLIYGQGNPGNAGAVQTPDIQGIDQRSPEWGNALASAGEGIASFYDTEIKRATADNLKAQNTVIAQDALLKEAQTLSTIAGTDSTKFDLSQKMRLADISAQAAAENLRQTKVQTDIAISRDAREALKNTSDIAEAAERMLTMREQRTKIPQELANLRIQHQQVREQINIMRKDGTLKDIEISLRKAGINPSDPQWVRMLGIAFDKMAKDPERIKKNFENLKNSIWNWLF